MLNFLQKIRLSDKLRGMVYKGSDELSESDYLGEAEFSEADRT